MLMVPLKILFWLLLLGVCYTYFFYGMLLRILTRPQLPLAPVPEANDLPFVVHIIAAFNEEDVVERKLSNALLLNYPADKLRTVLVADGSDDQTVALALRFPEVEVLYDSRRRGKMAALNRAVTISGQHGEFLVFSDANTLLNKEAIRKMVAHYQDARVGGVSAEKKVQVNHRTFVKGEGLYWRYESGLKKLDSAYHSVIGAAGELFSVRTALFRPLSESVLLDDLMISLDICRRGYLIRYEPEAFAMEEPSLTLADERLRKIRISTGAFQAMTLTTDLMNPFRHRKLAFQYLSHRVMRWVFCPLAIPLILLLNLLLVAQGAGAIYHAFLLAQGAFYGFAALARVLMNMKVSVPNLFYLPYYFLFLHTAIWQGFWQFLFGDVSPLWKKSRREITHLNGL